MKRGTPEHPKLLALCAILNIKKFEAVGILELLWHFTAKYAPQGNIGKFSDAAIAKAVGWERPTGTKGVTPECRLSAALVEAQWLDSDPAHRLIVHDWADHADQAVARRLSRQGLDFVRHVTSLPVPEPEPEPEPEPNTCASPNGTARVVDFPSTDNPPFETTEPNALFAVKAPKPKAVRGMTAQQEAWFTQWWAEFWLRKGRKEARAAFAKQVKTEARFQQVMAATQAQKPEALQRIAEGKTPKWGEGWLNGERWEDELQPARAENSPAYRRCPVPEAADSFYPELPE